MTPSGNDDAMIRPLIILTAVLCRGRSHRDFVRAVSLDDPSARTSCSGYGCRACCSPAAIGATLAVAA